MKFIVLFIFIFSLQLSQAREVVFGDELETITVTYGEKTILRFPSLVKTVSNVKDFEIVPVDETDPDYSLLSIRPIFRKSKGKVLFVLDDGTVIRVLAKTIKSNMPSKVDSFYEFISKKNIVNKSQNLTSVSELELMKAMIRNDSVTGYKKIDLVRTIWKVRKGLKAKLVSVYTGKNLNGYVFKLENTLRKKSLKISVNQISLGKPNQAIMGQVDDEIIYPKKIGKAVTYLRIVAKPTSVYTDISLPYERYQEKK